MTPIRGLAAPQRDDCARFLRELRREFPLSQCHGSWTRREWNSQLQMTARNTILGIYRFRRANS